MKRRREVEHEKALADQNEAGETADKVLPQDFIKRHNEILPIQTQMTFDHLRGIW